MDAKKQKKSNCPYTLEQYQRLAKKAIEDARKGVNYTPNEEVLRS